MKKKTQQMLGFFFMGKEYQSLMLIVHSQH